MIVLFASFDVDGRAGMFDSGDIDIFTHIVCKHLFPKYLNNNFEKIR